MLRETEESCLYLIQLAKKFNLDLDKILNHTTNDGTTLFFNASMFSEEITKFLLDQNVKVNSIDHKFSTPSFRVRLKLVFLY